MKIGITGTMGAGKSLVSNYIASKGYPVFDADVMVHELYNKETVQEWLKKTFGPLVINENGVDRQVLADVLFSNPTALKQLEDYIHPLVRDAIAAFDQPLVFVEVPLLFEANFSDLFDIIVVVVADDALRFDRLRRRGLSEETIESREQRQFSTAKKSQLADVLLDNSKDKETLYRDIDRFLERLEDGDNL